MRLGLPSRCTLLRAEPLLVRIDYPCNQPWPMTLQSIQAEAKSSPESCMNQQTHASTPQKQRHSASCVQKAKTNRSASCYHSKQSVFCSVMTKFNGASSKRQQVSRPCAQPLLAAAKLRWNVVPFVPFAILGHYGLSLTMKQRYQLVVE